MLSSRISQSQKQATLAQAGKDSLAMEVLQMDMSHLGTPMRSLSLKKIVPPRGSRSNSKKPEARTLEEKGQTSTRMYIYLYIYVYI